MMPLFTVGNPSDLTEAGNIDLLDRPQVQNEDGSISTVRSMSFNENGSEILVPTVSDDGHIMSDQEAIDAYHKTGKHLGKFKSVDAANVYSEALHKQQADYYTPKDTKPAEQPKGNTDDFYNWMTDARMRGYSWDEIDKSVQTWVQQSHDAGYSDADIERALGYDPDAAEAAIKKMIDERIAEATTNADGTKKEVDPNKSLWDVFRDHIRASSGGMLAQDVAGNHSPNPDPQDPEKMSWGQHFAGLAGDLIGDTPVGVAGAIGGGFAGSGIPVFGTAIGAGAGAMGLPALVRSAYADQFTNGNIKDPEDFLRRTGKVALDTGKAAAVGAIAGPSGQLGGKIAGFGGTVLAEIGAFSLAGPAIMEGRAPTPRDVIDASIMVVGFRSSMWAGGKARAFIQTRRALMDIYKETGLMPQQVVAKAQTDEAFRQELIQRVAQGDQTVSSRYSNGKVTVDGAEVKPAPVRASEKPEALEADPLAPKAAVEAPTAPAGAPNASPRTAIGKYKAGDTVGEYRVSKVNEDHTYELEPVNPGEGRVKITGVKNPEDHASVGGRIVARMAEGDAPVQTYKVEDPKEWYRAYFNREHPVTKYLNELRADGAKIPDAENAQLLMRAAQNTSGVGRYTVEQGTVKWNKAEGRFAPDGGKGLDEIMKPVKGNPRDPEGFWSYGMAKWAVQQLSKGKEAAGINLQDAITHVKEMETKHPDYVKVWRELQDWQNSSLKALDDAGFFRPPTKTTPGEYDTIVAAQPDHLPSYVESQSTGGTGTGRVFKPVKRAEGHALRIRDVQQSLMQDAFIRYSMATKNIAKRAAYEKIGLPAGIAKTVEPKTYKITLTDRELAAIQQELLADPQFSDAVIYRKYTGQELKPNEDFFFKDGKLVKVEYSDPAFAQYLRGLDAETLSWLEKRAAAITSFVRSSVVHMPDFPVRMVAWDRQLGFMTDPEMRALGSGFFRGVAEVITNGKYMKEYESRGGLQHVLDDVSTSKYIKNKIKGYTKDDTIAQKVWNRSNPINWLRAWSDFIMKSSQVGRYTREREIGTSVSQAIEAAHEQTFPRAGGGGYRAQRLNKTIMFLNAYLQSMEITARGMLGSRGFKKLTGIDVKNVKGKPYKAADFWIKGALLMTIPALTQYFLYKNEDWYKGMSVWERNNSYIIPTPWGPFTLHALPIASFIFMDLPIRIAQAIEKNPQAGQDIGKSAGWSLVPPGYALFTNVMNPIIAYLSGKDPSRNFSDVVPDFIAKEHQPPNQYTENTSHLARLISQTLWMVPVVKNLDINPPLVDLAIRNWVGPLGANAERAAEIALKKAGVLDPELASTPIAEWPIFSSFLARYPSATAAPIMQWRDRMNTYEQIHGDMLKAMTLNDINTFSKLVDANPAMAAIVGLNLKVEDKLALTNVPNLEPFIAKLTETFDALPQDQIEELARIRAAFSIAYKTAHTIEMTETPETRDFIEQVQPTGKDMNVPLTSDDKLQSLDRIYISMQHMAEKGVAIMDGLSH